MNIVIDRDQLLTPLSRIVSLTEKRGIMPVLSNVLINFYGENIEFISTDLEMSIIAKASIKTDYKGSILVHARRFYETLRELASAPVEIVFGESTLALKQKWTEIELSILDVENFPTVNRMVGKGFTIKGSEIIQMLEKVSFAISTEDTKVALCGVYMEGRDGNITAVGTDGFRMAVYRIQSEKAGEFEGIIWPKRAIVEIERLFREDDEIEVLIERGKVQLSKENLLLITRLIEEMYPNYERVIPKETVPVRVERDALMKGLKRLMAVAGKAEPVFVKIWNHTMQLSVESEAGRGKEVIEVIYDGEEVSISLNMRFLMEAISHIEDSTIVIGLTGGRGPLVFEGEGERFYKNIIMPIRV